MPLFDSYLTTLADEMVDAAGTVYLHTAQPTDADPTLGRTTTGGGAFENGLATVATNWTDAANGDFTNAVAFDFGVATADVGTIIWWSYYKGAVKVAYGSVPSTTVNSGGGFLINANTMNVNGSTL